MNLILESSNENLEYIDNSNINHNNSCAFSFIIENAASFKSLISYLKQINKEGPWTFRPNGITYIQGNYEIGILVEVIMKSSQINYNFVSENDEYIAILNLNVIKNNISGIRKHHSLQIIKSNNIEDCNKLVFRCINIDKNGAEILGGLSSISYMEIPSISEYNIIYPPIYPDNEISPNITTSALELKEVLNPIVKSKCSSVSIKATNNEIFIQGIVVEGNSGIFAQIKNKNVITIAGLEIFGVKHLQNDILIESTIHGNVIKILHKTLSLASDGKVKFYFHNDLPIKIVIELGYGIIKYYIDQK